MENNYPEFDSLDEDLQRSCKAGAKVYLVGSRALATLDRFDDETKTVYLNIGTKKIPQHTRYTTQQYAEMLQKDQIVAKSRLTDTEQGGFRVKPRDRALARLDNQPELKRETAVPVKQPIDIAAEIGYINFKDNKFSKDPKDGFIKIKYSIQKQTVQLELDSEQIEKLKALGILEDK